jgi:hypothetical protein
MSCDQYWEGDPYLVVAYRQAEEFRFERKNTEMHLQGWYNYEAFSAVIAQFAYGMNGKKGKKPSEYRKYPLAITQREKEAEKQRKIEYTLRWVAKGQEVTENG